MNVKKLRELYDIDSDILIKGIKINSKEIEEGDLFVCTMGVTVDRHDFIDEAIEKGASAVVVSREVGEKKVPIIKVDNTNEELRRVCSKFYDYPYQKMKMIGVTGTTGKTTVAELIYQLLGSSCAYLGTNGRKYKDFDEKIRNTTPDVDRLYKYMDDAYRHHTSIFCMEASSEAFYRHRLDDIKYDIAILTNIMEDHLNIHKTRENYIECKCQLFRQVKEDGYSILNSGDSLFERVKKASSSNIVTYGYKESDTLWIKSYEEEINKTRITYQYQNKEYQVESPLLGDFNVLNLSAAILSLLTLSIPMEEITKRVKEIKQIEGRMEILPFTKDYTIMLDYAHTTDALDKILSYLNKVKKGRIITVVGSAGGREKEKREGMGKVVLEKSDYVIFTMDDPRDEDVNQIIDDLIGSCKKENYERIIDRKEAINKALSMAEKEDIILVAGKGRDNYMAIGKEYIPYNDYEVIKNYFD